MRSFCEALSLPGWSHQSIWGYDQQVGTYFAQLWRDSDTNDDPTVWINGCDPIGSCVQLADRIGLETGVDAGKVMLSMQCGQSGEGKAGSC